MNWRDVTKKDVLEAIQKFEKEKPDYYKSKTTYLVYHGIVYPGKQIRRMAYFTAFGVEPEHFYGGEDTINFFKNLGFDTYWTTRDKVVPEYENQISNM
jgi:hypothetical protein